jgi:hypothetical protein
MTRIATYAYRYKRPPRERKAVPLEVPAVVKAGKRSKAAPKPAQPASPAIVTARKPRTAPSFGEAPDLSTEEHQRRGDAADALFREVVRRARGRT